MKAVSWKVAWVGMALAIGMASQAGASASTSPVDQQQAADAQVAKIGDPARYLANQREKVAAAKSGKNGKISSHDIRRLEAAEREIERLVSGRNNLNDLNSAERVTVYNAQETIAGITSGEDRTRMVCKRRQLAGTRLHTTECLTKEQSDARAAAAKEATRSTQNPSCVPGETSSCN
ncbi:hypothetical protein [Lysobacter sp. M15]|uniref:hypothetical protein n=1 Tax=Lysobacter sp. M15 TaxID=2916837 RepID=UPI001F5A4241|nr:hypothetical protein [Lysobacter sp. M15]